MNCYIYQIINQITHEKYVGQTTNFSRRQSGHLCALRQNRHPNPKLQNAWNKYGENNFVWTVKQFNLTKTELDQLEIQTIKDEDSFNHGYNLTPGGTGGNTRYHRIIDFEQFCFIYAGNTHFSNMANQTAKYIGCDGSTISTIRRGISYDDYREQYSKLPQQEKDRYLSLFIERFHLDTVPTPKCADRLTDETVVDFLCLISCFGKGAEVAFLREVGHAKGLGHGLKTNKNYFIQSKMIYNALSNEEIKERAERVYNDYHIQSHLTYKLARKALVARVDCAL